MLEADAAEQTFAAELWDERPLFGRLLEYSTADVMKHQVNGMRQESSGQERIHGQLEQRQQLLMNPTKDLERE